MTVMSQLSVQARAATGMAVSTCIMWRTSAGKSGPNRPTKTATMLWSLEPPGKSTILQFRMGTGKRSTLLSRALLCSAISSLLAAVLEQPRTFMPQWKLRACGLRTVLRSRERSTVGCLSAGRLRAVSVSLRVHWAITIGHKAIGTPWVSFVHCSRLRHISPILCALVNIACAL